MKRCLWIHILIWSAYFTGAPAHGALNIPSNLSTGEQVLLLQILGFGTSFHPVDNPYPLGGYSGLEVGLSLESIPTSDIGYFGSGASTGQSYDRALVYPRLTIGKGIYDSVDLFFSFVPYTQSMASSIYGGGLRWTFFQATFVPANFSLLASASNTNLSNVFISQTEGLDLVSGVNVDPFSFYVGAGVFYAQGQFDPTITAQNARTNQTSQSFHTMIGIGFAINELFSALEIDTYSNTTIALKLGARL